jgi:hypothetical protein
MVPVRKRAQNWTPANAPIGPNASNSVYGEKFTTPARAGRRTR